MNELPAGKREAGKLARRDRMYEAAVTLFREQGYENTTVDQITRRAGVAKGTFFNYFPTKDAVLRYMGRARSAGWARRAWRAAAPRRSATSNASWRRWQPVWSATGSWSS